MAEESVNYKISDKNRRVFQAQMLSWYDKYKRPIPWRTKDGETPNPYHVWLSEIMCQQTTVQAVIPYFLKFIDRWPDIESLARAERDDVLDAWAGLGYYSRARNLHKCAQVIVSDYTGEFPAHQKDLKTLPGIGDYTSAAIMCMAFNQPATVVDGNVERIMARYFDIQKPLPHSKKDLKRAASLFFASNLTRPGCFAQSLMDLGAMVCTPRSPKCDICPISENCQGRIKGTAENLPAKLPKKIKPKRIGNVYWITNEHGEVLLERRPDDELLGGTTGLPTTQWVGKGEVSTIWPNAQTYENLHISHSFTHFDLDLALFHDQLDPSSHIPCGHFWIPRHEIENMRLPTVFHKALKKFLANA